MPAVNENPLIQAIKSKMPQQSSPEDLLMFILSKFDLVPKEEGETEQEPMNVQTQESHVP